MKWFKHHTDLRRGERVAAYLAACDKRTEAYGFLVALIELIADHMSPDHPDPTVTLPLREWARQLDCHHHTVEKYMSKLQIAGVVAMDRPGGSWRVSCPELRYLADDYLRKSGQSPANVRKEEIRTDETRTEGEDPAAPPPSTPLPEGFVLNGERREVAERNCPAGDPEAIFRKFMAYQRAKGTIAADWDAMWEKWTLDERGVRSSAKPMSGDDREARERCGLERMIRDGLLNIAEGAPDETDEDYYARAKAANERRIQRLSS